MRTLTNSLYTQAVDPLNCWTLPVVCRAAAFSLEAVITDASVTPEETVSQEPKLLTADQQWSILHLQAWLGLHTHWFMVRVVHPPAAKSSGKSRFSVQADERSALENMAVVILRFWVRTRHGLTWVFGLTKGHNKLDVERLTGRENSPSLKNLSVGLKSIKNFRGSLNVKNKQTIKKSKDNRPLYVDTFPSTVNISTFPGEIDSHFWSIAFVIVFRNAQKILFFLDFTTISMNDF